MKSLGPRPCWSLWVWGLPSLCFHACISFSYWNKVFLCQATWVAARWAPKAPEGQVGTHIKETRKTSQRSDFRAFS